MRQRSTSGNGRGKLLRCYATTALLLLTLVAIVISYFAVLPRGVALPSPAKLSGRYTKLLRFDDDLGKYDSELLRLGARLEFVQVVFRHGARTPLSDRYVGPVAAVPGVTTSASTLATDVDTRNQTALRGLASGTPALSHPDTEDPATATHAGRLGAAAATWLRTDACEYSVKGPKMLIESQPGAPALTRDDVRAMLRALRAEGPVGRKAVQGAVQKSGVGEVAEGAVVGVQQQAQQQQATQNCSCGQLTRYGYSQAVTLGQWLLHRYGSGEGGSSSSSRSGGDGSGGSVQGHGSAQRLRGPLALWGAGDDAARRLSGVAARSTHVARALLTLQGVLEGLSGAADTARHAVVPVAVAPQGYQLLYANTDLCPRLALLARLADRAVQVTSDAEGGADEARVRRALSLPPLVPDQASSWLSWKRLLDAAMCEEAARADGQRMAAAEAAEKVQAVPAPEAAAAQAEVEVADTGLHGKPGGVQEEEEGERKGARARELMSEEVDGARTGKRVQVGAPSHRLKRSNAFRRHAGSREQLLAHSSEVPSAAAGADRSGEALVGGMAGGGAAGGTDGRGRRTLLAGEEHVASGGVARRGGSGNSSRSDSGVGGGAWSLWGGHRWQPVAAPLAGGLDDDLYAIVDEQATRRVAAVLGPACNGTGTCQQLLQLGAGLMLQEMLVGLYGAAATASYRGTASSTGANPGSDADAAALLDDATKGHRADGGGSSGSASGAEGAGGMGQNGSSSTSSDDSQAQGQGPLRGAAALAAAVGPRRPPVLELLSGHDSTLMPIMAALGHPLSRWPAFAAHLVIELHRVPVGRGAVPTSTAGGTGAQGQGDGEGDGEGSQAEEEQGRVGDEEAQGLLVQAGQQQAEVEELAEGDWEGEEEDVQAERERRAEEGEAAGGEHGEEGRVMEGRAVKEGASGGPSRSVGRLRRLLRWEELHGGLREWGRGWSRGGRRQGCCHGLRQRRLQQLGIEAEVAQDGDSWGGTNSRQQDGQDEQYEYRVRLIYNGGSAYRVLSIDTPSEGRTWLPRLDSLAAVLQPYNITRPAYEQLCGRVDDLAAVLQGELGAAATATAHGHFFDKDPQLPATAVAAVRAAGAAAKASLAAGLPKGGASGLRRG